MPRAWRRLGRTLLVLFLIIAPFWLLSSSTSLHRFFLKPIQRTTGLTIQIKKSGLSLLRGEFRIYGLSLADQKGMFEFSSSVVRIAMSPLSLLKGQIIISRFEVEDPHLSLLKKSEKKPRPVSEIVRQFFSLYEKSLLLQSIVVKKTLIHSLQLDRPDTAPLSVKEIELTLEPKLTQAILGKITIKGLSQGHTPLELLKTEITLTPNGGEIHSLELIQESLKLSLTAHWKGNFSKGEFLTEGKFLSTKYLTEPVSFRIESDFERDVAQIKRIEAQMGSGKLEGAGSFHLLSKLYAIDFEARELPIELIFQKIDSPVLAPAQGISEVKGTAQGRLPELSAHAEATIHNLRHNNLAANRASGQIGLQWPLLEFEAHIYPEENNIEAGQVKGGVLFERRHPQDKIRAYVKQVDVSFQEAPISKLLPDLNLSGILSGELLLEGAEKDGEPTVRGKGNGQVLGGSLGVISIESLESRLRVEPGGVFFFQETVLQLTNLNPILLPNPIRLEGLGDKLIFAGEPSSSLSLKGSYDYLTRGFHIDRLLIRSPKGDLKIEGVYQESLDFRVKGPAQISFLQMFRAFIGESSGWANLDLKIQGTFEDPEIQGPVLLQDSALEIRSLKETLTELEGKLEFQKKRVTSDLKGNFGNGSFSLKGNVQFEKLNPSFFDLKLVGSSLPFQYDKNLNLELNSNLHLTGPASDPLLAGKVEIVEGRYTKRFEIHKFVLKPIVRGSEDQKTKKLPRVQFDLDVKSAGDLQIKNNISEIYLSCDLLVRGTSDAPKILGGFSLIEGQFQYLTANFTMTEGRVEYVNPNRSDPYLILRGERELPPNYVVFLKIEGYLNNLEIDLSSSPSRDRDDILSLLAFGMTRDELQRTSGLGTKLGLDLALEEAARPFTGVLSKATGLDVRLKPTAEGPYSPSRLSLQSEVTDRLSLELRSDLAPDTAERTFQANYYLTDNVLLKGFRTRTASTDPQYHFNLSLRFRIR
ncbi:MAG: translocation/assembly module TamB domain-containing protein [Deltaproteobacteria bacterium]|nr:translocation/assembly module TamB domain-containing protein [Deltaproteobacteria bacterium]